MNYENVYLLHSDADFIINTTPRGTYPDNDGFAIDPKLCLSLKGINGLYMLGCFSIGEVYG